MNKEFNILIAGVGGQGVILMSEILGNAAVKDGLSVKGSEALGMAARGGSVTSAIRIGEGVMAPLITAGKCDVLVGMEPAEALRNIAYLHPDTRVLINTESIIPFTVTVGQSRYPDLKTIIEKLSLASDKVIQLNAARIATEAGSTLSANISMLGALFGTSDVPIKIETIKEQIRKRFSANLSPINIRVFNLGYQQASALSHS